VKHSWKRWLFAGLGGIALACAGIVVFHEREPHYDGKSLSEWLQGYLQAPDNSAEERQCEAAVLHIGSNAIPYLLENLQSRPAWKNKVPVVARYLPRRLRTGWLRLAVDDRDQAAEWLMGFSILSQGDVPVLPSLVDAMKSSKNDRAQVVLCIGCCGKPAVPVLVSILTNRANDQMVRETAINALSELDTNSTAAVEALLSCLQESSPVSAVALETLGEMAARPELCVPALANKLEAADAATRTRMLFALGQFGIRAQSALPAVKHLLEDKDLRVRAAATNALQAIEAR